jgi:phosphatidylinositol alpha 1,6-mannosyltransferase
MNQQQQQPQYQQQQPPQAQQQQQQHRLLLYTTCYNVLDGVTLTIRKLEQEILAAGHAVCILTTRSGDINNTHAYFDAKQRNAANRQVIFLDNAFRIPFLHDPSKPQLTYQIGFGLSPAIQQELHDFSPTIMHITTTDITSMHLIHYARSREIPLMGTFHSNIPDYMEHYAGLSWLRPILGHFFRHQYNFFQTLCVPTPYIQRNLIEHYQMHQVTQLRLWGRGVDVEQFHPQARSYAYRHSLGIADDDVVVLWVGRLVPEKRTDIFCHTVQRLAEARVPFRALVVGDGPCEEEIKRLPHTIFCGWLNVEQLAVTYASADIFLFPSSVETFGNVTLEAMASGLPVVVESKCSGHLVRDGENGFACRAGDDTVFFRKTLQLVLNHDLRRRFSAESRRMSLKLEKRKIVRQMLDYYTCVTQEFYQDYGGHHANRDAVYTKPNSFVAGKQPRPLLFILVERLFILLFGVIWHMMDSFMLMQERILGFSVVASTAGHAHIRAPIPSSSIKEHVDSASHAVCKQVEEAPSFFELSNVDMARDADAQEQEDPMLSSSCARSSLLDCSSDYSTDDDVDESVSDDTRSTVSSNSSDESELSSASLTSSSTVSTQRRRDGRLLLDGEFSLTHALAMAFIHCVFFVSRWESHLRDSCASFWSYTCRVQQQDQRHKRKNSDVLAAALDGDDEIVVAVDNDQVTTTMIVIR